MIRKSPYQGSGFSFINMMDQCQKSAPSVYVGFLTLIIWKSALWYDCGTIGWKESIFIKIACGGWAPKTSQKRNFPVIYIGSFVALLDTGDGGGTQKPKPKKKKKKKDEVFSLFGDFLAPAPVRKPSGRNPFNLNRIRFLISGQRAMPPVPAFGRTKIMQLQLHRHCQECWFNFGESLVQAVHNLWQDLDS